MTPQQLQDATIEYCRMCGVDPFMAQRFTGDNYATYGLPKWKIAAPKIEDAARISAAIEFVTNYRDPI